MERHREKANYYVCHCFHFVFLCLVLLVDGWCCSCWCCSFFPHFVVGLFCMRARSKYQPGLVEANIGHQPNDSCHYVAVVLPYSCSYFIAIAFHRNTDIIRNQANKMKCRRRNKKSTITATKTHAVELKPNIYIYKYIKTRSKRKCKRLLCEYIVSVKRVSNVHNSINICTNEWANERMDGTFSRSVVWLLGWLLGWLVWVAHLCGI